MIMKMRTLQIALLSLGTIAGCTFGNNAAELPVAKSPRGVAASLVVPSGKISGELIELGDEGMVIRDTGNRLLFVPYQLIRSFTPSKLPDSYKLSVGERPVGDKRSRLEAVSHFPQGMTPEIRRAVLGAAGQQDFVIVK